MRETVGDMRERTTRKDRREVAWNQFKWRIDS
jgi:hypothetical protein